MWCCCSLKFYVCFLTCVTVVNYICSDILFFIFFFFKQKTAYEMRISDWSSDVCSSDLPDPCGLYDFCEHRAGPAAHIDDPGAFPVREAVDATVGKQAREPVRGPFLAEQLALAAAGELRSEEHTSELQSLMRISYAVFRLKKKKQMNIPLTHVSP